MSDWNAEANHMVDRLRARDVITLPEVDRAFRSVPRHAFLPAANAQRAYTDGAIVTKMQDGLPISSSSDPAVMAIMIEQLRLDPGARVLEIGTGTGYNAAILAEMTGENGHVVSVDIDDDTCSNASDNLARTGYAGVHVECRDGALGIPEQAPFDRIIATVGIHEISRHWFDQLKPGGILVAPLWVRGAQCLVALEKKDRSLDSVSMRWGGFMRMRGALAGPESYVILPNGWTVAAENPAAFDGQIVAHLLDQVPGKHDALTGQIGSSLSAFSLFIASQDPRVIVLSRSDEANQLASYAVGLLDANAASMCLAISTIADDADQRRQHVRSYGGDEVLEAMKGYLEQWAALGRPGIEQLRMTATLLPESEDIQAKTAAPGALVRGSFTMRFSWASAGP